MSNLQWFRLYHRIIDDEKIRLLAFEDRWHFIAVCCLKADGLLDEPESPLKWRKIAVKLGVQLRELDEIKRRLSEVGLVDDDMQPVAWDELQYRSDTSTDRVRKYREKTKKNNGETQRNVSVTTQETETETETETDKTSSLRSDDVSLAIQAYSEMAGRTGLPRPRVINEARRRKIASTLKAYSIDLWREAVAAIEASSFCRGQNNTGWVASLDFLLQRKSFDGLIEGKYADRQARASPQSEQPQRRLNLADAFGAVRQAKEASYGYEDRETVSGPVLYLPSQRGQ